MDTKENKNNLMSDNTNTESLNDKINQEDITVEKDNLENEKQLDSFEEDYSLLDRPLLLDKLKTIINNYNIELIKDAVENIKTVFYKKYNSDIEEAKKKFVEAGGDIIDFKFTDEVSESKFKDLYKQYKTKKIEFNKEKEKEKEDNLNKKNSIIDKINELINKEESIGKTFSDFHELQKQWKEIGLVSQNMEKTLWNKYHNTVERFYDFISINKELRDLDFKKNAELKNELCEKAEKLQEEESVTKAFKILQTYHEQWREIGPVLREQREEIWERFKAATVKINKKHQDFFEELKQQQVKNLERKIELCDNVEKLIEEDIDKTKKWEEKTKELLSIQEEWRSIGFAPKKDNNKIYKRFKIACDQFFSKKRDFYKEIKEIQKQNLKLKLDLCTEAEKLIDSEDWKKTTEAYIKLQKQWKEIGQVSKKQSEIVWKRFRSACDLFFNKKADFFNNIDSRQNENLELKLKLIEKIKTFEKGDDDKKSLDILIGFQKEWASIGHVPIKNKEEIQKQFRAVLDNKFDDLKINIKERNSLNFKSKVDSWINSKSNDKIYLERNKLMNKIKEINNEIVLYENNIGFFSASKKSQGLINDITRKIERLKDQIKDLKKKVIILDKAMSE